MNPNKLLWRLLHINEAAELALYLAKGESPETFFENSPVENAVVYQLIIIGEAAAVILKKYPQFAALHPEIPWVEMRNMRNLYVHEYYRDFSNESWYMVSEKLPLIYKLINAVINSLTKD
ncbi:MAG: DUF86 domain-containing protein [Candidatus Pacebacteria bacterium]|nr:DUF86 domain-containing protein [Candidatus Paceibacterota bacterium]